MIQTIIMCGGRGSRLNEQTENTPKPMILIGKVPILIHIMRIYYSCGFNEFILPVGYKGEVIKQYFCNYQMMTNDLKIDYKNGTNIKYINDCTEKWNVKIIDTGLETNKKDRLKQLKDYVSDENFFLTYADGVSDIDINKLLQFHLSHGKIATVTGIKISSQFGKLNINDKDRVIKFAEKDDESGLISGGFFVFNKKIFNYLNHGDDFESGVLEYLAKVGELMVHKNHGFWHSMDTYRDMIALNKMWESGKAPWKMS